MAIIKINMPQATYLAYQDAFAEIYKLDANKKKNLDMAIKQFVDDIYAAGQMKLDSPTIEGADDAELQKTKDKIKGNQDGVDIT